jgi:F0F1-type ATP synthase assembly protein I
MARHVYAVEMESAGVYLATRPREIPFLAIRGVSDIIGLRRDDLWKEYACQSAAAFAYSFLSKLPLDSVHEPESHNFPSRPTSAVINQAIEENKAGQRILYLAAFFCLVTGVVILIWQIHHQQPVMAILGFLLALLSLPLFTWIKSTKKQNLALRLVEVPLSRADTAKQAAELVSKLFKQSMEIPLDEHSVHPNIPPREEIDN